MSQRAVSWNREQNGSLTDYLNELIDKGYYIQSVIPGFTSNAQSKWNYILDGAVILYEEQKKLISFD